MKDVDNQIKKLKNKLINNERTINACLYYINNDKVVSDEANINMAKGSANAIKYGLGLSTISGALIGGFTTMKISGFFVGACVGFSAGLIGSMAYLFLNTKEHTKNKILNEKNKTIQQLKKQNEVIKQKISELEGNIQSTTYEEYVPTKTTKKVTQNVFEDKLNKKSNNDIERDM